MVQRAKLSADLVANTAQFETGMERARRKLNDFSGAAAAAGKAAAAGFAVVATALTALTIRQASVIDETSKMARSLGVGLSEFQALALVADEAGVGQEQLATAFTKTQKAIAEAASGTKSYSEAFSKIGLNAQELINLRPDEQFNKIAEALSKIENPTQRTALALEIFGKSGRGVINVLDDFAKKSAEAREFNDKFNISLSEIDGQKVEEAKDSFERVGRAVGGLGNTIAVEVAPIVTGLSNDLLNAGVDGEDFGAAVADGMQVAATAIDVVRHAVMGMRLFFAAATTGVVDFGAKAVRTFFEAQQAILNSVNSITGSNFEPSDQMVEAVYQLEQSSKRGKAAVGSIVDEMKEFETTSVKFTRYQTEAAERAAVAVKRSSAGAAAARVADEESVGTAVKKTADNAEKSAEKTAKAYKTVAVQAEKTTAVFDGMGNSIASALEQAATSGGKLSDVLKNIGKSLASSAFNALGNSLDSLIGNIFGDPFASSGPTLGGEMFGPPAPSSFATGIKRVPRDMIARVHKNEQIVPAQQANKNMGGGEVVVNIVNNAGANVTQKKTNTANGQQIDVMIDQAIADNISRPGSKAQQALQAYNSRSLTRR